MSFRDWKLGTKQAVGFGVILVMMAAVNVYSINRMSLLRNDLEAVTHIWLKQAITISNISRNTWNLRLTQLYHAFAPDEAREQEQIEEIIALLNAIIEDGEVWDSLKTVAGERNMDSEAMALFDRYDENWEVYQDLSQEFLLLEKDEQRRQALSLLQGERDSLFDSLTTALVELVSLSEQDALAAAARAEQTFQRTRRVIQTLLLITIVISIAMAWLLVGLITGPVRELVIAAGTVSKGDLNVKLDVQGKDEMGHLAHSFNQMTAALRTSTEKTERQAAQLRLQSEELRENYLELEEKSASLAEQQAQTEAKNRELEAALKQLQAAQQQLILREKMASLGQLTAGIAHEIKNPLNFVNNFARLTNDLVEELEEELEAQRVRLDEEALEHVQDVLEDLKFNAGKIQEHGKRADGIVRSMLDHSRSAPGERRAVDLNALLEEYVNLAYHGMRARRPDFNVSIKRDYDDASGEVEMVPQEVGRVFLNLLDNAFYAVNVRKGEAGAGFEPLVYVSTERRDGSVCIRIQDNGGGIPDEVSSRIFEPFFTTKPTGSGTGLGLFLSYEIITKGHGGSLKFENVPGEGATFFITLPAV